jgi:glycosyltransferase involved in cell wall biosynthesis
MQNLVSIIIPTHNRCTFLAEAIESAVGQTYRPIEIIVVDDGSTDKTEELIAGWILQFNSIIKLIKLPHQGAPAARNAGIYAARGEFIQFLDSDDQLHPQKIALQISELLRYPKAQLCGSNYFAGRAAPADFKSSIDINGTTLLSSTIELEVWTYLFRRRLVDLVGAWDENIQVCQDVEYMARAATFITELNPFIEKPLYFYRQHNEPRITGKIRSLETYSKMTSALGYIVTKPRMSGPEAQQILRKFFFEAAQAQFRYATAEQREAFHSHFKRLQAPSHEHALMWYIRIRSAVQRIRARGLFAGLR